MSSNQYAYTKGMSVETALHSLVERTLHTKEYALGVFVNISGAFHSFKVDVTINRLRAKNPALSCSVKTSLICFNILNF